MVKKGKYKSEDDFLSSPIETRSKLIGEGQVTARQEPQQVSWRLPREQLLWLSERVDGNINYVVSRILANAIAELSEALARGDVDIDKFYR